MVAFAVVAGGPAVVVVALSVVLVVNGIVVAGMGEVVVVGTLLGEPTDAAPVIVVVSMPDVAATVVGVGI